MIRRRAWAWSLGLAAAVGLGPAAAQAETLPERASVAVDAGGAGDEGPVIERRIRERTDVVLRGEGILPARPGTDDAVVFVEVDDLDGPEPGYAFEAWVMRGDARAGERTRLECTLCTESEIVERVETAVLDQLRGLEPQPPAVTPAVTPTVTPPADEDGPAVDPSARPGRTPLGALGRAGVGLMVVGAAATAAGAVLVALPPRVDPADPLLETTTRPPGAVVLGAGVAMLVSGAVMLVVDRRRTHGPAARRLQPALGGWVLRF